MPPGGQDVALRILGLVELNLRSDGITSTIQDDTVCLFRAVPDKPTGSTFGMSSAVSQLVRGPKLCKLYCIEQRSPDGELVKFAYKLQDASGETVREWHLDVSHGLHTHRVVSGTKEPQHISFSGGLDAMVQDMCHDIRGLMHGGI